MKTQFKLLFSAAVFLLAGTSAWAQSTAEEVPGDNFSLEGALELFKKSASPQEFEQLLNSPNSKVNNLDLNGNGEIDYIRVIDKNEGNVHAFILSAVVSSSESQDVAVIELEKRNDGSAVLQIVGDADVYGIETIIEPTEEVRVNAGTTTARTVVNVWTWPSVQYVYGPAYSVWVSPWYWGYYPGWYRPWRPLAWTVYDPFWAPYRPYYSVCYRHRIVYASAIYRPYRTTSVIVYNRHRTQINTFRNSSHGYRYDRGERNAYGSNHRYDREQGRRSDNNSYSTGRSSSNGRTSGNSRSDTYRSNTRNRSDANTTTNRSNATRSTETRSTETRSNDTRTLQRKSPERNSSTDRSTSFNRGSRDFKPQVQRQQAPQRQAGPQRQVAPQRQQAPQRQMRSAPSPSHQRSSPAQSRPQGGGGGGHQRGRH